MPHPLFQGQLLMLTGRVVAQPTGQTATSFVARDVQLVLQSADAAGSLLAEVTPPILRLAPASFFHG